MKSCAAKVHWYIDTRHWPCDVSALTDLNPIYDPYLFTVWHYVTMTRRLLQCGHIGAKVVPLGQPMKGPFPLTVESYKCTIQDEDGT